MNVLCFILFTRCGDFIVNTTEGRLSGYQMKSRNGRNIISFSGIPYAKPPVGQLRFEEAELPERWNGIREAQFFGNICLQSLHHVKIVSSAIVGSEDCLYLSVYTPKLSPTKLYPVLVYNHGGGFEFGAGEIEARPGYFLDHDVVLVAVNYRLGPLGFLSMEDEDLPGNLGLKDQVMALKWIQRNIENFGGDPNSVTVFGESAGGASAYYHMISPLSKGLIHKAISQSGVALSPWGFLKPGVARERAILAAREVQCPTENTKEMVQCLKSVDATQIFKPYKYFPMTQLEIRPTFSPVIETFSKNPFTPQNPHEMKPVPIPWMTGCSSIEGIVKTAYFSKFPNNYNYLENGFFKMANSLIFKDNDTIPVDVIKKIKHYYFGNNTINKDLARNISDMISDAWFIWPMIKSLRRHEGPHYVYYNDYEGEHTLQNAYGTNKLINGTAHADELLYLFDFDLPLQLKGDDRKFSKLLVNLWVNFATYGTPTPTNFKFKWPQWDDTNQKFVKFTNKGPVLEQKLLSERINFWSSISENYL